MISNEIIKELTLIIIENEKPDKIILFGSYAKGNANDESDLDLLVVKDGDLPRPFRGKETRKNWHGLHLSFFNFPWKKVSKNTCT
ncbi:MAG: nucleotidyltransferase domain-containing protein [Chitinispirillaceae bacterium]|nr:nucleotidyltransferase domain-containing protein [Chitinispirillaceae bacterium]